MILRIHRAGCENDYATQMIVDLHTHSTASDGALAPAELLAAAAAAGTGMLAITDHDTVAGFKNLTNATDCRLIPGVELSTVWRKMALHVVGLNIDSSNRALQVGLQRQQDARKERGHIIAAKLEKLGFTDVLAGATQLAGGNALARPHFAEHLVNTGQVKSMADAFRKYLGPGKPGDVKSVWPPLDEIIGWIHAAGGSAVLAHPAKYKLSNLKLEELCKDFAATGGDALEVISGRQDTALTRRLGKLATRLNLKASCGSDFHRRSQHWADIGEVAPLPESCEPVWAAWL